MKIEFTMLSRNIRIITRKKFEVIWETLRLLEGNIFDIDLWMSV